MTLHPIIERIKHWIEADERTKAELARDSGVDYGTIHKFLLDDRNIGGKALIDLMMTVGATIIPPPRTNDDDAVALATLVKLIMDRDGITRAKATKVAKRLIREEYLKRRRDPPDGMPKEIRTVSERVAKSTVSLPPSSSS